MGLFPLGVGAGSGDMESSIYDPVGVVQQLVGINASQILTNKTLTDGVFNGTATGTAILDEDDMLSNSALHVATQQSIKAYVDTSVIPALTQEQVEDFAGNMVSRATGTHTGIAITYQDSDGDMDFIVDHDAAVNFVANEHLDWALDLGVINIHDNNILASSIAQHEASINHDALLNVGSNTHAQIDSHIANIANPHSVIASQVTIADVGGLYAGGNVELALQEIGDGTTLDARYVNVSGDTMTGVLDMGDNAITSVNYIDFDLINGISAAEGRLVHNEDDGTLNYGLKGGNVNLQIGLENVLRGKNVTGSSLINGKPGRVSGASGANPELSFSDADDPTAMESIGLFTEDIGTNANGYLTTGGLVRDFDTSGGLYSETWNDGDRIFVGNTAGSLTKVLPVGTERKIFIGLVLRAHATEGVMWVHPINIFFLQELSGMGISSPIDNNLLAYDSGAGMWTNQTAVEAGFDSIYLRLDAANDPIIGALQINNTLFVDGIADTVQATIQAHSTQTDNILEIQDSSGNIFARVPGAGDIVIANMLAFGSRNSADNADTNLISLNASDNLTIGTAAGVNDLTMFSASSQRYNVGGNEVMRATSTAVRSTTGATLGTATIRWGTFYGRDIVQTGNADTVQHVVKANSTQLENISENRASDGTTVYSGFDKVGTLLMAETTTPTAVANFGKVYPKADNNLYFQDGAGTEKTIHDSNDTLSYCMVLSSYDTEPSRASESNIHGGLLELANADPLSTGVDIVVTKGTGKVIIVVNAGSDIAGDIIIVGTSVDRDTGATTPADTDTITVDTLTMDNSTVDSNGNTVHGFEGAYISSKWFTGTVTLSTTDLTLTDVDVFHVSFEQFNDQSDLVLNTFDVNLFTTNANAEFDAYLFDLHTTTGDKCDIENHAELHIGADGETAIANKYWRLRRGSIGQALDGTTDGIWVDLHYSNSPAYVEDVTIKVWATRTASLTIN